jgi:hypothetical protein
MLRRLGFEYRKPKALPRVADEDKQAEFIAFYQDLMTKLAADEAVYFTDAVHPEQQTKPAFGKYRGEQPKQITCPRNLGQCGLPPLRGSQKMALTSKIPHPPDPVTCILPTPEPD